MSDLYRPLAQQPINPKNGDKYRDSDGLIREFRYGRWVIMPVVEPVELGKIRLR